VRSIVILDRNLSPNSPFIFYPSPPDDVGAIVIETGSSSVKAGYAGEDTPKAVFPSQVGITFEDEYDEGYDESNETAVRSQMLGQTGSQASDMERSETIDQVASGHAERKNAKLRRRVHLEGGPTFFRPGQEIISPVQHGLVMDWDAVERIWNYSMRNRLMVDTQESPLVLLEPYYNTKSRREKMVEISFESLDVPAMYIMKDPVAAAFSMGKSTALVVQLGSGVTSVVPVHEGYVLHRAASKTKIAGDSLDALLYRTIFQARGIEDIPVPYMYTRVPRPRQTPVAAAAAAAATVAPASATSSSSGSAASSQSDGSSQSKDGQSSAPEVTHFVYRRADFRKPIYLREAQQDAMRLRRQNLAKEASESELTDPSDMNALLARIAKNSVPTIESLMLQLPRNWMPRFTASFEAYAQSTVLRNCRESLARVHDQSFDPSLYARMPTRNFTLPDGKTISLGVERLLLGEALFNPALGLGDEIEYDLDPGFQFEGLHKMVCSTVDACDPDIRRDLYSTVIPVGGLSLTRDLPLRLQKEMDALLPMGLRVRTLVSPSTIERQFAAWIGGSILASLGTFQQLWLSKQEYEEYGASIVQRKCP